MRVIAIAIAEGAFSGGCGVPAQLFVCFVVRNPQADYGGLFSGAPSTAGYLGMTAAPRQSAGSLTARELPV